MRNPDILKQTNFQSRIIPIDFAGYPERIMLAGSPVNAKGQFANDGSAIGILVEDVRRDYAYGEIAVAGFVDYEIAQNHAGIEYTKECMTALKNIVFEGVGDKWIETGGGSGGEVSWNDLTDKPFDEKSETLFTLNLDTDKTVYDQYEGFKAQGFAVMQTNMAVWDLTTTLETLGINDITDLSDFIGAITETYQGGKVVVEEITEDNIKSGVLTLNTYLGAPATITSDGNVIITIEGSPNTGKPVAFLQSITKVITKPLDPKFLPVEDLEVTFTHEIKAYSEDFKCNKTYDEIVSAFESNQTITAKVLTIIPDGTWDISYPLYFGTTKGDITLLYMCRDATRNMGVNMFTLTQDNEVTNTQLGDLIGSGTEA